jgi:phospholipid/cholesterol/gamma-HCH transport system substrate-binding protein
MRASASSFTGHVLTAVGCVLAAAGVVLAYLIFGGSLATGSTSHLRAAVPTSASLTPGARVTMAGAKVGRVTKVSRQGYATVVDMELTDKRVTPVPADTRVTLRQRTPVGENYVALTPGTSKAKLPQSAVLPIRQSDEYVDVDQLLSVLQGRSKQEARDLVRGLGGALDGRGDDLNLVLGRTSQVVQAAGHVFVTLDDSKRQTGQLVDQLGRLAAAVGERSAAVAAVADRGLAALRALAARDDELKRTLDVLPSTLTQVQRTSGTLRATAAAATPVVAGLADAVGDLRPAIANLGPAAATGRRAVAELGRAAGPLTTTLTRATALSKPLSAALPDLHKALCQLNPMVRYIEPYAKDLVSPLIGLGSASNSYDAIGHLIRLQPIVGENSVVGLPESVSKAIYTLTRSGLFGKAMPLSWNPYPKPGKLGLEGASPDGGNVFGPQSMKAAGYTFPRIQADC